MTLSFEYPTPLPSTKGWGNGWPDCQRFQMVDVPPFAFGIHRDIAELVHLLVGEMKSRGFTFMVPGCWGFGCRATKGGSGEVPSFHSWGLALDINAPENVFGADVSTSNIAMKNRWVVTFLRSYGFFWLGPDIKDWMHFSFVGSPADAEGMTAKARRELGDERMYADFRRGVRDAKDGKPMEEGQDGDYEFGYRMEERATSRPECKCDLALHEHDDRYARKNSHPHTVTVT